MFCALSFQMGNDIKVDIAQKHPGVPHIFWYPPFEANVRFFSPPYIHNVRDISFCDLPISLTLKKNTCNNELLYISFCLQAVVKACKKHCVRVRCAGRTHSWGPMYSDEGQMVMKMHNLKRHDGDQCLLIQVSCKNVIHFPWLSMPFKAGGYVRLITTNADWAPYSLRWVVHESMLFYSPHSSLSL